MKTKQNGILKSSERNVSALPGTNPVGIGQVPVMHSDRAHSKISPSRLKALEICPGFLSDDTREVHAVTLQGTKCHEALDSGDDSALTEEELGWVRMCREITSGFTGETHREVRLEVLDGIWGFADLVILDRLADAATLIDYKFGLNAQEDVTTNPAAQAYVLGIFQKWSEVDEVLVHYLYPRRDEISTHRFYRKDVAMIRLRIQTIVARVQQATPNLYAPVPDNCQYCGRKATCSALHKMVLPLATRYANNHDISVANADFSVVKSPEQWASLMAYAPVLEQMADSIKRHALEFREQSGVEIPGYEMRSRQGKKKIVSAEIAYRQACWEHCPHCGDTVIEAWADDRLRGKSARCPSCNVEVDPIPAAVTHEAFMRCVEVSAKQLADAVGEKAARGQKGKRIAELEGKLRDAGVLEMGGESFYLARSRA